MADVKSVPNGCNTINAYLIVKDGKAAIDFYQNAFGMTGGMCMHGPDGKSIMHAELHLGNSTIMLTEENEQWGTKSAETMGGSPASLHLYVDNVDEAFKTALEAGCTEIFPVMDTFWGDRFGKLADPFGYQWGIATHIEDVPAEEMEHRAEAWFKQAAEQG